jgi:hypothetical protein
MIRFPNLPKVIKGGIVLIDPESVWGIKREVKK